MHEHIDQEIKNHFGDFKDPMQEPAFGQTQGLPETDPAFVTKHLVEQVDRERTEAALPPIDLYEPLFTGEKNLTVLVDSITAGTSLQHTSALPQPLITAAIRLAVLIEYKVTTPEGGSFPQIYIIPISNLFTVSIPLVYFERNANPEMISIDTATKLLNEMFKNARLIPEPPKALEKLLKQPPPFTIPVAKGP